ncbi:MAG TPA: PKD domain-containing protein [Caldilineae bacterium]|nr:PKD domain-containing protein [Caldilineae bacterium]
MTDTPDNIQPTQRLDAPEPDLVPPPPDAPVPPPAGDADGGFWANASGGVKAGVILGVVLAILALMWLLVALWGGDKPEPTPVPPLTPIPTTEAPTPEAGNPSLTATSTTYIYAGPSAAYPQAGLLQAGLSAEIIGRNDARTWWAIKFPEGPNGVGWVPNNLVTTANADNAPVLSPPPLPTPTTAPPIAITDWKGEYFNNPSLQGEPTTVRNDREINFNWGGQSPADGVPGEDWSARWSIQREVAAGTYTIDVWVDDGVRVYVDNQLVIDGWQTGGARHYTANVNITRGEHEVRVEYFQSKDDSLIQVNFGYDAGAYPDWKGEYFNNPSLQGEPTTVRNDREINFDWGTGAPAPGLPTDNYSVRWSRHAQFDEGDYLFTVEVEGGVRLWLDGRLLIDDWTSGPFRTRTAQSGVIQAGPHDLRVDYFKTAGNGRIRVSWQPLTGQPPTAVIDLPTQTIVAGEPVQFSAQRSMAAPGRQIVTYEWDFGNGLGSNDMNPVVTFAAPGQYLVSLKIYDDLAQMGQSSVTITVEPAQAQSPVAVIVGPASGMAGEVLSFSGLDSQGDIIDYDWDFGDGQTAKGAEVSHVYPQAGVYTLILTVIDRNGLTNSTALNVTITAAPEPTQPPAPEPTQTPEPEPSPTPPGGDITGVTWYLRSMTTGRAAPVPALPNTTVTLLITPKSDDAGVFSGNGGCNAYQGDYQILGPGQIQFTNLSQSQNLCDPDIMEQETNFFTLLQTMQQYVAAGETMTLQSAAGALDFATTP